MPLMRRPADGELLELIEESGRNVLRTTLLLRELLADYPEQAALAQDVRQCEHEGDRITHDVIHRLAGGSARQGAVRCGRGAPPRHGAR